MTISVDMGRKATKTNKQRHKTLKQRRIQHSYDVICFLGSNCSQSYRHVGGPGLEVIKLFSWSTQLSRKFIMLINVKMPTIVGILTFISMINTPSESLKAKKVFIFSFFSFVSN